MSYVEFLAHEEGYLLRAEQSRLERQELVYFMHATAGKSFKPSALAAMRKRLMGAEGRGPGGNGRFASEEQRQRFEENVRKARAERERKRNNRW